MARSENPTSGKEPKQQAQASRDLEVKRNADGVKGGRRIQKGGDPEEGGE